MLPLSASKKTDLLAEMNALIAVSVTTVPPTGDQSLRTLILVMVTNLLPESARDLT
jgi:hypothetical protein